VFKRELAYDEELHQVSLDKLKGKFLDVLDYDLVWLKPSRHLISSEASDLARNHPHWR